MTFYKTEERALMPINLNYWNRSVNYLKTKKILNEKSKNNYFNCLY